MNNDTYYFESMEPWMLRDCVAQKQTCYCMHNGVGLGIIELALLF